MRRRRGVARVWRGRKRGDKRKSNSIKKMAFLPRPCCYTPLKAFTSPVRRRAPIDRPEHRHDPPRRRRAHPWPRGGGGAARPGPQLREHRGSSRRRRTSSSSCRSCPRSHSRLLDKTHQRAKAPVLRRHGDRRGWAHARDASEGAGERDGRRRELLPIPSSWSLKQQQRLPRRLRISPPPTSVRAQELLLGRRRRRGGVGTKDTRGRGRRPQRLLGQRARQPDDVLGDGGGVGQQRQAQRREAQRRRGREQPRVIPPRDEAALLLLPVAASGRGPPSRPRAPRRVGALARDAVRLEALDGDAERAAREAQRRVADQPLEARARVEVGRGAPSLFFYAPRSVDGADNVGGGQARERKRHLLLLEVASLVLVVFLVDGCACVCVCCSPRRRPSPRGGSSSPPPPEEQDGSPPQRVCLLLSSAPSAAACASSASATDAGPDPRRGQRRKQRVSRGVRDEPGVERDAELLERDLGRGRESESGRGERGRGDSGGSRSGAGRRRSNFSSIRPVVGRERARRRRCRDGGGLGLEPAEVGVGVLLLVLRRRRRRRHRSRRLACRNGPVPVPVRSFYVFPVANCNKLLVRTRASQKQKQKRAQKNARRGARKRTRIEALFPKRARRRSRRRRIAKKKKKNKKTHASASAAAAESPSASPGTRLRTRSPSES